ncbi:MAG: glycine cleavage system protein GcvH [Promethearchaeota archaeon]
MAMGYNLREDVKYTASHEWLRVDGNIGVVGITSYAQHQLGDIVFIELPNIGLVFEKGSNVAEIESVKAVGDLLLPVSGEIVEVNNVLEESPEIVNSSPFDDGWILKIKINHSDELGTLLSVEEYKKIIESEGH